MNAGQLRKILDNPMDPVDDNEEILFQWDNGQLVYIYPESTTYVEMSNGTLKEGFEGDVSGDKVKCGVVFKTL
jgi:hypothetical protein